MPHTALPAVLADGRTIRPIQDYFFLRQDPVKDRIGEGLLYAPQGSEEWPPTGTVIAVGPGRISPPCPKCGVSAGERVPLEIKVGDRIMFKRRAGSALFPDHREIDERKLFGILRLQEIDIVAFLDEAEAGS